MKEEELKIYLDKIYEVGRKNGSIDIKNKILKRINRDYSLVAIKQPMDLRMKILKLIDKTNL